KRGDKLLRFFFVDFSFLPHLSDNAESEHRLVICILQHTMPVPSHLICFLSSFLPLLAISKADWLFSHSLSWTSNCERVLFATYSGSKVQQRNLCFMMTPIINSQFPL